MADQVTTGRFVGRTNEPSAERARVLGSVAQLLVLVAWFAEAREVAENAVTIAGQVGDVAPEVLALVAAGPRNRQIAQALFVSPKTVGVHVSNVLAKLGAAGRVEAAAVAHRLGLD